MMGSSRAHSSFFFFTTTTTTFLLLMSITLTHFRNGRVFSFPSPRISISSSLSLRRIGPQAVQLRMSNNNRQDFGLTEETLGALISNSLSHAKSTLQEIQEDDTQSATKSPSDESLSSFRSSAKEQVQDLLANTLTRTKSTLNRRDRYSSFGNTSTTAKHSTKAKPSPPPPLATPPSSYSGDPTISHTALAHLLWKSTLRPGVDAAIDATCGNGHDSLYLAELLLKNATGYSELYCIDIQDCACDTTRTKLEELLLDPAVFEERVSILRQSHSSLPNSPRAPVGLVCYNLGYLPNAEKSYTTQVGSTLQSIGHATKLLRRNGLISIMTYPMTNPNEDYAVCALLECMALFSSNQIDWRQYLEELGPDPVVSENGSHDSVRNAVKEIAETIPSGTTWRVMEHKMMGRPLAPKLLTATRIK